MGVNNTHSSYNKMLPSWLKVRDCEQGQSAIHGAEEKYLPKLSGQSKEEYKKYRELAYFFNAVGPTIDALQGLVMSKEPSISADGLEDLVNHFDGERHINDFISDSIAELIRTARLGLLTDFPSIDTTDLSQKDVEENKLNPYTTFYTAENITYWREGLVVLREFYEEVDEKDEFNAIQKVQYRVLEIVDAKYQQRVFRQNSEGSWDVHETIYPRFKGNPLAQIPFTFIPTAEVQEPPLMDLAHANIAHYQTHADHRHGMHFTAVPTAVITGYSADDSEGFRIGSSNAWVFEDADVKASYLEFSGAGLNSLKEEKADLLQHMASLGARVILSDSKKAAESADTRKYKQLSQDSVLARLANSLSKAITKHLTLMAEWSTYSASEVSVELNTEYVSEKMDAQTGQLLLQLHLAGKISQRTLFDSLKKGQLINTANNAEDEKDIAEAEAMGELGGLGDAEE